jgi:hypothetical protein
MTPHNAPYICIYMVYMYTNNICIHEHKRIKRQTVFRLHIQLYDVYIRISSPIPKAPVMKLFFAKFPELGFSELEIFDFECLFSDLEF